MAAITVVDDFVAGFPSGERLSSSVLARYAKGGFDTGWRVRVSFADVTRELHIVADRSFPYTAPHVVLATPPPALTWPHLEENGRLCLYPSGTSVSVDRPAHVVEEILREACRLIEECDRGTNERDFRDEFLTYWKIASGVEPHGVITLLEPRPPSRRIVVWPADMSVAGESADMVAAWCSRCIATAIRPDRDLRDGILIWLPEPLLPSEYPRTGADVRRMAARSTPEILHALEDLAATKAAAIDVIFGAPTSNGVCFAAARLLLKPPASRLDAGFRPGRTPRKRLVERYFAMSTARRAPVDRADHSWVHGRDRDDRQDALRNRRVAVVGVGSLGGSVARLLAQSGVGEVLLVDPDVLDWANVGRHALGAGEVHQNKAVALARRLTQDFPHLKITGCKGPLGPATVRLVDELAAYDLVVASTGDWATDAFLNDVHSEIVAFPPLVYAWIEPYAAAAHAVLIHRGDACFRCGVNELGRPHLAVTDWPDERGALREPACGATFSPYGPIELCYAHALVAECAIDAIVAARARTVHRVWIGRRARVEAAGGAWSTAWIAEMGDPGEGGTTVKRPWRADSACRVCGVRSRS